ncbi:MAG: Fe(2+) transporter permease subunit FeoB [Spirochaetes bacterium]|nr:Fe(2+) transporter permease subunit FeoB [Spirochaetota bacterium]
MEKISIALAGNPNCGKTTLFNGLTGGRVKTGNWPGVTVEKREGTAKYNDKSAVIVDLPGIYSFSAQSEDEIAARDYILSSEPSLIINIVDATNLERNLFLTTQLIEMKVPMVLCVNMMDLAKAQNIEINIDDLSKTLGIPVIGLSAVKFKDITMLKEKLFTIIEDPLISDVFVEYPNEIERVIAGWSDKVKTTANKLSIDERWIAIKLLEDDEWVLNKVLKSSDLTKNEISVEQHKIENILGDTPDIVCADYRYGFIHGVSTAVVKKHAVRRTITDKIDSIILNRIIGIPVFLGVMYLVFWATISVGGAFIDFFDILAGTVFVDGLGNLLAYMHTPDWFIAIIAGSIGGGIQTVATFIPVIFTMFFMLSLLEDSGYMARAAFVIDRFMKFIGLPGKSFIPMLVGFGCTVPAIMGTRTLENKKDRYLTIFMAPFMSCGARLPVYALFTAAFFPKSGGFIVFSIYLTGIILAVATGFLLKNTLFKGEASYFIMELPPYHVPRPKHIFLHTWERLKSFIWRAGKVIIIVVSALSLLNSLGTDGSFNNEDSGDSVLSATGKFITPVFSPMGIEKENWPASVGLFTGIFAKEAVVGTLNSLYSQIAEKEGLMETESIEENDFDFSAGIAEAFASIPEGFSGVADSFKDPLGIGFLGDSDEESISEEIGTDTAVFRLMNRFFSKGPFQAYAYLLFILIYFPCVAAFGAVVQETGKFMGTLNAVYLTVLAWITATLFYQITVGHSLLWIVFSVILFLLMAATLKWLGTRKNIII